MNTHETRAKKLAVFDESNFDINTCEEANTPTATLDVAFFGVILQVSVPETCV